MYLFAWKCIIDMLKYEMSIKSLLLLLNWNIMVRGWMLYRQTFLWDGNRTNHHQIYLHLSIQANGHTEVPHSLKKNVQKEAGN